MRTALVAVKARFDELDRGRRSGSPRLPMAATVWTAVLVGTAAVTWGSSWRLRPEVDRAMAWSAQQLLDGELWRALTATVLTRDPFMLISLLVVTGLYLWLLERLSNPWTALVLWAAGAVWGYVGTTLFLLVSSRAGWELATTTLTTSDYGPSGGTAALAAAVVVLMRQRLVTVTSIAVLLIGSAAHHRVADVEHIIAFATVLILAPLIPRPPRGDPPTRPRTREG